MNRPLGAPTDPNPFVCIPRVGNIAGVTGDALVMGGAAPILFRFVVARRPLAWSALRSGLLVRARPSAATPAGAGGGGRRGARRAGPAVSPPGRRGPFRGRGGVPSAPGGRRAGAPAARRPGGERGGGEGGPSAAPRPPAPLGGPWPPPLSSFVSSVPPWAILLQSGLPGGRGRRARPGRPAVSQCGGGGGVGGGVISSP